MIRKTVNHLATMRHEEVYSFFNDNCRIKGKIKEKINNECRNISLIIIKIMVYVHCQQDIIQKVIRNG